MSSEPVKWHQKINSHNQVLFDVFKLPCAPVFFTDGGDASRNYPMPELAKLLRWHRNLLNHFKPHVGEILRRTKGDHTSFETISFFASSAEDVGRLFQKYADDSW
jgi:hypothetical protein